MTLAILGGDPEIRQPLAPYVTIGAEERLAVHRVMESGMISGYYGSWGEQYMGGPEVRAFEAAWSTRFGCRHSVAVNSNTSGLIAAMGAIGISPGDEVIVPPYTMSATAMAPLVYGGIPVFVDLERETFCLDPVRVAEAITPRTKAIFAVNLFGHPAPLAELRKLADEHGIWLIEDNAQAPLATEHGRLTGTVGHIGVFSLNYHKHFHTGEGGVCTTDDDDLALRLQAIRNHGENVVQPLGLENITNMVGFNLRMTELCAAIGVEQLRKADRLVDDRERIANRLTAAFSGLPGLRPPVVRDGCRHVYYVWPMLFDAVQLGVSRASFCAALQAEGFPFSEGYVTPLYKLPLFQRRVAIGREGYPFNLTNRVYDDGLCPVAEKLHDSDFGLFEICSGQIGPAEEQSLIAAFMKVYENRHLLQKMDMSGAA